MPKRTAPPPYKNSAPIGVGAIDDGPRLVRLAWISGDLSARPRPIRLLAPLGSGRASVDILVTENLAGEPVLVVARVGRFVLPLPGAEIFDCSVPEQIALPAQNMPSGPIHTQPPAPSMGAQVACGSRDPLLAALRRLLLLAVLAAASGQAGLRVGARAPLPAPVRRRGPSWRTMPGAQR